MGCKATTADASKTDGVWTVNIGARRITIDVSGFTLLELLVVIVIIGLLAGYVAPRYFSQVGKSEIQVAKAQIDALDKALDQYRLDLRRYPTADERLQALTTKPANEPNWNRPDSRRPCSRSS